MYGLFHAAVPYLFSGDYSAANALVDELEVLAREKDATLRQGPRNLNLDVVNVEVP
jgi:hypothetical protein